MPQLINLKGGSSLISERAIPKKELIQMARDYRKQRHDIIKAHGNNKNDSRTCYFSSKVYETILSTGCEGIRTYYGVRSEMVEGKLEHLHTIILVGVRNGKPALDDKDYVALAANPEEEDTIWEWGSLCPPGKECVGDTFLAEIDADLTPAVVEN